MSDAMPARVAIGDAVIYQKLQDDVVVLNMSTQQYFGLDDTGATMWKLLLEIGDVNAVVARLLETYDVGEAAIVSDLRSLLNELLAAGLLKSIPSDQSAVKGG